MSSQNIPQKQSFVAISRRIEGKVPVVDNFWLSHKQENLPTTIRDIVWIF